MPAPVVLAGLLRRRDLVRSLRSSWFRTGAAAPKRPPEAATPRVSGDFLLERRRVELRRVELNLCAVVDEQGSVFHSEVGQLC